MRELEFALTYDAGANRVADILADESEASIRSISLHATEQSLWRVDYATGPNRSLEEIEDAFLAGDYYADCLASDACGATQRTQVLDETDDTLVLYSYWERTAVCESIPHMALHHLGQGILFETLREGREYTWRVIHSEDGDIRGFFNEVEAAVGDRIGLDINRLMEASTPADGPGGIPEELSKEQAETLRAAVEHGYYETPREVDLNDLADRLDVPRSTLAYRLRGAEEYLAKQEISRRQSSEVSSPPL